MGNSADIRLTERSHEIRTALAEERAVLPTAAMAAKEPCDMALEELFTRSERDMTYDPHGYASRYFRSAARKEIQRRGTNLSDAQAGHKILYAVIEFLRSGKSLKESMCRDYVDGGWACLLGDIARGEPIR
jgi:hypothetical protein